MALRISLGQTVIILKFVMFAPFPETEGCSKLPITGTAYGASGSDLLLVASTTANGRSIIKSVASDAPSQTAPYRHFRTILGWGADLIAGDRLSCGAILCTGRRFGSGHTRIFIGAGRGDDTWFTSRIDWVRDLMACGGTQIMLFDIGRGKIEKASSVYSESLNHSATGVALSPKIALASSDHLINVIDMRARTISSTAVSCSNTTNSVIAGCNAFFTACPRVFEFNRDSSSISIKSMAQALGVWHVSVPCDESAPVNPSKCIEAAFAWHPARGPMAIVVSRDVERYMLRRTSVSLIDPRRHHTVTEVPGADFGDQTSSYRFRRSSHSFYPGHASGQPYIGAISHDTGTPSFLTL